MAVLNPHIREARNAISELESEADVKFPTKPNWEEVDRQMDRLARAVSDLRRHYNEQR